MNQIEKYYEVLGLSIDASLAEIKQAYRNLAKTQHPDCFVDPHLKQQAEVDIKRLNEAYQFLKSYLTDTPDSQDNRLSRSSSANPSVSTKPACVEEIYKAGVEYADRKNYEAALEQFSTAIRIDKQHRDAYHARAAVLSKLGYDNWARSDLHKVAELDRSRSSKRSPDKAAETMLHWRCVQTLTGHTDGITAVASYRQGKMLASGSRDTTVILWNLQTGKPFCTLSGHTAAIESIAVSSDGQLLVSSSQDHSIKIWHLQSGTLLRTLVGHDSAVTSLALSPDKQILISGGLDHAVKVWHLKSDKMQHLVKANHAASICAVAVNRDGTELIVSSVDGSTTLWSVKPDGTLYPSARYRPYFNARIGLSAIALNARPYPLAGGSRQGTIELWDLEVGRLMRTFPQQLAAVSAIDIRADGQVLVSGYKDGLIQVWQVQTGEQLAYLNEHQGAITALRCGDNQTLFSGSLDSTIKLWRCETK